MLCCGDGDQTTHCDCGTGKTGHCAGAGVEAVAISHQRNRRRRQLLRPAGKRGHSPGNRARHLERNGPVSTRTWSGFACPTGRLRGRRGSSQTQWTGEARVALHSSGALNERRTSPVLRLRGAAVASVHPLMTFVRGSVPSLQGVPFALEGDPAAVRVAGRIVRDLGAEAFPISRNRKMAYHAWGAFTSPLLIALLVASEKLRTRRGFRPPRRAARRCQFCVRRWLTTPSLVRQELSAGRLCAGMRRWCGSICES